MVRWRRILVGVDGSEGSRKALEWAGDVAIQHNCELLVLTSWIPTPPPADQLSGTISVSAAATGRDEVAERLTVMIHEVLGGDPPIRVLPIVQEGNAAKLLIDQSENADLLVVGSRGYGGFIGLLLGSVSQHVAAHARCPVVVVR